MSLTGVQVYKTGWHFTGEKKDFFLKILRECSPTEFWWGTLSFLKTVEWCRFLLGKRR